jgi:hypothetical protein
MGPNGYGRLSRRCGKAQILPGWFESTESGFRGTAMVEDSSYGVAECLKGMNCVVSIYHITGK